MLTQNITLDFCRNDYKTITVKQRDKNSRNLLITCTDNGAIYKINNSTQECKYKMSTPDNRAIYKNATINTDGTVLITFDDNMLYELGTGKLEIQILEQATKRSLSTMILNVVIIGNVFHDDVITASDEFSALTDTLLSIEDSANKAKDTVELANKTIDRIEILETEVSSNEANRINTENERINAENIRIQNENKRQENTSKAIANAEKATESAIKATNDAISATEDSLIATELANTATTEANKATENTIQATSDLRELEEQVSSAETQRIANEEVRQSNEEKRQTDTSTAITNVEKATSDANTATENANIATQKVNKALEDLAKTTQSKADAIICEAEGTTIVATDTADAGFEGLSLYGKSKQGSTTGAQLFDVSTIIIKHITPDTGVMYDNDSWRLTEDYIKVNPLSDYCISQSTDVYFQFSIYFYDSEKTYISCKDMGGHFTKEAFTTTENTAYIRVAYSVKVSGNDVDRGNIMLNAGTTALPYEPYTGNKPSPNPEYPQEVVSAGDGGSVEGKVCGKNLFDASFRWYNNSNAILANGGSVIEEKGVYKFTASKEDAHIWMHCNTSKAYETTYGPLMFIPDNVTQISVSLSNKDFKKNMFCFYDENLICIGMRGTDNASNGYEWTFTVPNGAKYCTLRFGLYPATVGQTYETTVMVNYGAPLPYEPYKEQAITLQTPNGLPGIPVSDASLATYTDENGQMWCADEIDVERGVYVKRIGVVQPTEWQASTVASNTTGYRYVVTPGMKPIQYIPVVCSHYIQSTKSSYTQAGNYVSTREANTDGRIHIRTTDESLSTLERFTEWVVKNNMLVFYILATPIETPLSDEEIAAYKALHTNKPTTTIMNSENVFMKVKYVADTENHIKQNYIPLSKYTALEERVAAIEELVIS